MIHRRDKNGPPDPDRVAIARHLAEKGRTPGDELAAAVGLSAEQFWVLVNHPWFEITGKGWDLTHQGQNQGQ